MAVSSIRCGALTAVNTPDRPGGYRGAAGGLSRIESPQPVRQPASARHVDRGRGFHAVIGRTADSLAAHRRRVADDTRATLAIDAVVIARHVGEPGRGNVSSLAHPELVPRLAGTFHKTFNVNFSL